MKKVKLLVPIIFCLVLVANLSLAQSKSKFDQWPELKTFHGVMSQTFHPSEEGDLAPIKKRSGEMTEKAMALANSKIPAEFSKKDVLEAVKKLETDSKLLDELVKKNASDDVISKSLTDLHDTFHLIVERCNKNDEEHKREMREGQKEDHHD